MTIRPCRSVLIFLTVACLAASAPGQYPSSSIDLASRLSLNQIGGGDGSDIWGWTDPLTSKEYALMARTNGVSFVDVTDPYNAVYLGNLPSNNGAVDAWRDVKTYGNYAYVVADGNVGPHGMQVFDLTNLRGITSPTTFSATTTENTFRNAHNIIVNEDSGFAYVVGSDLNGGQALAYDLSNPASPQFIRNINVDGYIHDAQVVNYSGPDPDHAGREVMFSASANDFVIIDVTDKGNNGAFRIWENVYPGVEYVHQGWLSEDQTIFFLNDELDSQWTHRWDVTDLDSPVYLGTSGPTAGSAIDHNLYVKGNYVFQANYTSGIRVAEITDAATGTLNEVAWLDTHPSNNGANFNGAWSVYPYFESGTIISSDINDGLFVSRVTVEPADFNADGIVDCVDIDQLVEAISTGSTQPWFDLTGDGNLNLADRDAWLAAAGAANLASGNPYLLGDANLDGAVNGADYIIWSSNRFTATPAWCSGDFNADGVVNGADYVLWSSFRFQSSDTNPVPEPAGWLIVLGITVAAGRRQWS
jgi:choice-of-anchor B domain-containing protein